MSTRQRLRTMIVALLGVLLLALAPVALLAPTAAANPGGPGVTEVGDFPFDGQPIDDAPKQNGTPKKDERADKAEKLGGGVAGKVIDLGGGVARKVIDLGGSIAKCALNIVTPSVKCQL
ncbi:hypothetical protein OG874_27270 [Nocardia sp. NBC_00565]|uniref:hypothetical protein n=1 Tax=Nocardia sp. NBC_00565 TaxID=2975993 RepID=UPI002E8042F0|nr:hypothetical protein [Nocardia sp. NBC_00565]WUC00562.1 hypothetical protein OG874_27270 [Nocardia sp. NBC_00565]